MFPSSYIIYVILFIKWLQVGVGLINDSVIELNETFCSDSAYRGNIVYSWSFLVVKIQWNGVFIGPSEDLIYDNS